MGTGNSMNFSNKNLLTIRSSRQKPAVFADELKCYTLIKDK